MLKQRKEEPNKIGDINHIKYVVIDAAIRQLRLLYDLKEDRYDFILEAKPINSNSELIKELLLAALLKKNIYDDKKFHNLIQTISNYYDPEENILFFKTHEDRSIIETQNNLDLSKEFEKLIEWKFISLKFKDEILTSYHVDIDYLSFYVAGEETSQIINFLESAYNRKFDKKPSVLKDIALIGDFFSNEQSIEKLGNKLTSKAYNFNAEPLDPFLVSFIQEQIQKDIDVFVIGLGKYHTSIKREFFLDNLKEIYQTYKRNQNICIIFEKDMHILSKNGC